VDELILARWVVPVDGDHWTRFGKEQFGTRTDWMRGGFALRDKEVWGATDQGAVHFEGQSWRSYPEALKTNRPFATVAGRSGVWIIDRDGNLSHFDGNNWTIRSLNGVVPHAPPAGKGSRERPPSLEMTGDGRLWVSWRGLWRQDGETWREVRSVGGNVAEVWMIGHDAENVWVWLRRTREVAAVSADGHIAARHSLRDMGLTEDARLDALAEFGGRLWIASSSGLLTFGGGRWTNWGLPQRGRTITDVAMAAGRQPLGAGANTIVRRSCLVPLASARRLLPDAVRSRPADFSRASGQGRKQTGDRAGTGRNRR
jgi:hypothetical protein